MVLNNRHINPNPQLRLQLRHHTVAVIQSTRELFLVLILRKVDSHLSRNSLHCTCTCLLRNGHGWHMRVRNFKVKDVDPISPFQSGRFQKADVPKLGLDGARQLSESDQTSRIHPLSPRLPVTFSKGQHSHRGGRSNYGESISKPAEWALRTRFGLSLLMNNWL